MPAIDVMIATPTVDGKVFVNHAQSLTALAEAFQGSTNVRLRAPAYHMSSLLAQARGIFASLLLEDASATHLLFVDADVGFQPSAVSRMIELAKPFVTCLYPQRLYDFARMGAVSREVPDPALAARLSTDYVMHEALLRNESVQIDGAPIHPGFMRAAAAGMGLTLIHRSVFEAIAQKHPKLVCPPGEAHRAAGVRRSVLQCFEPVQLQTGLYAGEDVSFCLRWTHDCGGEIWSCIDEAASHAGMTVFSGRLSERLEHERSQGGAR